MISRYVELGFDGYKRVTIPINRGIRAFVISWRARNTMTVYNRTIMREIIKLFASFCAERGRRITRRARRPHVNHARVSLDENVLRN